ncbi:MAG: response regulator transcription factor [Chloracidobacterium sp.]|nr:response regulator transcription factor [Chloracidobacterium sp.]
MTKTYTKNPGPYIRTSIVAHHQLVRECLTSLIQNNQDLQVVTSCSLRSDTFKLDGCDIAVIYLEANDPVEIIRGVLDANPEIKVVAITDGEDLDSSTQALKLGAVGIVRSDQSSKLLIEAVRRAFKGETWLNQALLSNLLKNGDSTGVKMSNGNAGNAMETITRRETEVIAMIGKGLKSKVIAERLGISEATVRHHLSSIYGKLGVDDRLNLVIYAFRHGLIPLSDDSEED